MTTDPTPENVMDDVAGLMRASRTLMWVLKNVSADEDNRQDMFNAARTCAATAGALAATAEAQWPGFLPRLEASHPDEAGHIAGLINAVTSEGGAA